MSFTKNEPPSPEPAIDTVAMLGEEAAAVHGKPLPPHENQYVALNQLNSAALCLSGGGIRSASFALGVIQALASHPFPAKESKIDAAEESMLARFHYLSTVSGGGYCGSWLSAWRHHNDFPTLWSELTGRPRGPDHEPAAISWLRENSNFLTPKVGLTSADTWAALTIVVRNLILNWLVILPVLVLLILALKVLLVFGGYLAAIPHDQCWPAIALLILSAAALVWALRFSTRNRPTRQVDTADEPQSGGTPQPQTKLAGQSQVLGQYVPAALISAFLISMAAVTPCAYSTLGPPLSLVWPIMIGACFGFLVYLLGWLAAGLKLDLGDLVPWVISGAIYGIIVAIGAHVYFQATGSPLSDSADAKLSIFFFFRIPVILLLVFGTPWVVMSQLIAEMVFVGLTSGERDSDGDREWFGRAGGFLFFLALAWIVLMFLIFVGSDLAGEVFPKLKSTLVAAGGVSAIVTALLGKSRWTPAKGPAKGGKQVSANLALGLAASVFAITLLVGISWLLDYLLFGTSLSATGIMRPQVALHDWPGFPYELVWLVFAAAIAALVGVIASKNVNINRFSLHALYRNRLIRTYPGASNHRQNPETGPADMNPFTRFAQSDNPRMHELWPPTTSDLHPATNKKMWRPFHVINMTLNIASTKRLAWQERKAEPFTVTPIHSGSSCKGARHMALPGASRLERRSPFPGRRRARTWGIIRLRPLVCCSPFSMCGLDGGWVIPARKVRVPITMKALPSR
jgi:hypothetical protein